ncbi:uridine diphosphate glucose pyrophosphatase NUDT14 [Aplysia californica]|uniref:Uridine diphosphate glucose pyrophosphatase NUDT14 n=1 Tax=Aplysia californica TaxID=6500 RepID=A0ABM0K9W8_APLCA|nr:uridine diphosphate glucose pyrophosphatase NUDT14 [Aplysia californica]
MILSAVYLAEAETEVRGEHEVIDTEKWQSVRGLTVELCSGIVDRDEPFEKIAQSEVLEECGYDIPVKSLRRVTSFRNGVTLSGAMVTLFYAEVSDSQRVGPGGGLAQEGELIQVVELSVSESRKLLFDENVNREAGLLCALYWFFQHIWSERTKKE